MFVNVQYVSRVVIAPHLKRPCFGVCALVRDFSPKAECVLDLARESKRGPFVREVEKRLGDKIYGSSFARFFSSAGVEGSQGTGKCMCIKAWRNQWLQMRHWQIAHPFYKMGLHTNAAKDGVINYAGLQGEHIPDGSFNFPIWTNTDPVRSLQLSEILRWGQMRLQHKTPDDCICLRMLTLQRQAGAECFA